MDQSALAYARGPGWQAVDLVYDGAGLAMAVIVPDAGRLAEVTKGFDADFTIVDLKKKKRIENKWIASRCGWSIYDGMDVTGWPVMTVLKGRIAMRDDEILLPSIGEAVDFELAP